MILLQPLSQEFKKLTLNEHGVADSKQGVARKDESCGGPEPNIGALGYCGVVRAGEPNSPKASDYTAGAAHNRL